MRTVDPEDLLAFAGPLRQLARRLVVDEARADDVVQETWLAALRRPPVRSANLRGWLFAVARNVARRTGREETRRRGREERSARPESIVDDAAERAATQRELTDLLLHLEEPYRAVLLLRYFEDMSPMSIAKTLDLPVATVHTRILRGRDRLRDALERRFGDRDSWCAAMVGLVLGAPRPRVSLLPRPETWRFLVPLAVLATGAGLVGVLWPWGPEEVRALPAVPPPLEEPATEEEPVAPPEDEAPLEPDPRLLTDETEEAPPVDEPVDVEDPEIAVTEEPAPTEEPEVAVTEEPVVDPVTKDPAVEPREPSWTAATTRTGTPPGVVLITGGRTKIGTPVEDIEPLILANEQMAKPLAGETPQFSQKVEDFYLMPNEVTVEQYGAFVLATGARPPWPWGAAAVDEGRKQFLEEQGQQAKAAREQGIPFTKEKFEPEKWWDEHWRDSEWAIPEDQLDRPVVYVTYREAQAYARWAGLRLMTEFEFARASRGDTDNVYPWGNEFEVGACASLRSEMGRTMAVGSYPTGAANGCYDLVGNVWEWTESPYSKFPGYKTLRIKTGGRTSRIIEPLVPWDSNQRVLVGGSFQQNTVGTRIAVRMFAERIQSTDALGFRCAASAHPGMDAAQYMLREDVDRSVLPEDVKFYPDGTVATQIWYSEPGTAGSGDRTIEGYAIVKGYERLLFVPTMEIGANSTKQFEDMTVADGPSFIGVFSTDRSLMEPALEPGSYHVAFRCKGKLPDEMVVDEGTDPTDPTDIDFDPLADQVVPFTEAFGFDPEQDQYIFYDLSGMPLVALNSERRVRYDKMRGLATITVEPWEPPKKIDEDNPPIPMDTLRFRVMVAGKSGSKGFHFDMPLKIEPDSIDEVWVGR